MRNREILVVGYGSLLSGYGLLAKRRGGKSRLLARDAHPVVIRNARRGLAKPSSHGAYLAMDIEPVDRRFPFSASIATGSKRGGIGGLLLEFAREYAPVIARREDYDADAFERLIGLADREGKTLGEYLMEVARGTNFDLLEYRAAIRKRLGYTSAGYIFHPIEIDDGRVAIIAIGSGFEGSGDPQVTSLRRKFGLDRLLALEEAALAGLPGFDRAGQVGYLAECVLGGLHGLDVGDLIAGLDLESGLARELKLCLRPIAALERERFIEATSLDAARYAKRFSAGRNRDPGALHRLFGIE